MDRGCLGVLSDEEQFVPRHQGLWLAIDANQLSPRPESAKYFYVGWTDFECFGNCSDHRLVRCPVGGAFSDAHYECSTMASTDSRKLRARVDMDLKSNQRAKSQLSPCS